MNTKDKGEISQAVIMAQLLKKGKTVLMPYGDNQRYDLVIEENGQFYRIQCKTGHYKNGSITFNNYSSHGHRGKPVKTYVDEIDYFAVYCFDLDKCYLVPISECRTGKTVLRVIPPLNNQSKNINLASNYEI